MEIGVSGRAGRSAVQLVGLGHSIWVGGVDVPHLDLGASSALAPDPGEKTVTFMHVQVGIKCISI